MKPYNGPESVYVAPLAIAGSFRINGTTTPDDIRDGGSNQIRSVTRVSAGLFEVTIAERWPLPVENVLEDAWLQPVDATPVKVLTCAVVADSYSPVTRKFQILTTLVANTAASAYFDPLPDDPEDNCRVCFRLEGSQSPVGRNNR
jgi:hypothetical protein